jgi:peptide deformylase
MIKPILEIGDPTLRKENREIPAPEITSPEVQGIIDDLIETNRSVNGAGLAAPQIGVNVQMFVVEVKDNPRYPYKPDYPLTLVVNPKITPLSEKLMQIYEGCLSVPNLRGKVDRYAEIEVEYFDRGGAPQKRVVRGITAGTFQHEYDHLQATLFTDKVKDRATFNSWDSFKRFHEKSFIAYVKEIVDAYGS